MSPILQLIPPDIDFESAYQADLIGEPAVKFQTIAHACRAIRAAGNVSVIHAWGARALLPAVLMRPPRIIYSCGPEPRFTPLTNFLMRRPNVQIVCPTQTLADLHARRGVPPTHLHVIHPAFPTDTPLTRSDLSLRADDIVLLASGESTWAANHSAGVWCASILERLNPHYRLLLWGRGPLADRAVHFANQFGQPHMIVLAEQHLRRPIPFGSLIPLANYFLHTSRAPSAISPILQAHAAGLPIISTLTPTASELPRSGISLTAIDPPTPRRLAQHIVDLKIQTVPTPSAAPAPQSTLQQYRALYE
jgi:hypothetical protein